MLDDRERQIHLLLRQHPYLIDISLKGLKPEYEVVRDDKRLDLLFRLRRRLVVVEIKKTILGRKEIDQVVGYCRKLSSEGKLADKHYLVGKKPGNTQGLESYLSKKKYRIVLRYLGFDIPTDLIWDTLESAYVPILDEYRGQLRYQNAIKLRI
jgi:hypothetical protein